MRFSVIALLFIAGSSYGQKWEMEIVGGLMGYQGDLTQRHLAIRTLRPATGFNLKYNIENSFIIRGGIAWGKVTGNDKYNKQADLEARNLNFQSNIVEASLCVELNLVEPEIFYAYPYLFGGIGVFHFNSYTHDKDDKKTYLRPLSTEGQGMAEYPGRKPYSQTQFCLPFGAGWKLNINKRWDFIYEIGYRFLFTDYLDDVSKTYIDPEILANNKGPKAVELAYRGKNYPNGAPFAQKNGDQRGNSKIKDWYFINGVKLLFHLGKQ